MPDETFISRWGDPDLDDYGYVHVPGFIMRHYHRFKDGRGQEVGLTPREFAFMCHVMAFKYDVAGAQARPSLATVATRMGRHLSNVKDVRRDMERKGAMIVISGAEEGKPNVYSFQPLTAQCRLYETIHPVPKTVRGGSTENGTGGVPKTVHKESEDKSQNPSPPVHGLEQVIGGGRRVSAPEGFSIFTVIPDADIPAWARSQVVLIEDVILHSFGFPRASLPPAKQAQAWDLAKRLYVGGHGSEEVRRFYEYVVEDMGDTPFGIPILPHKYAEWRAHEKRTRRQGVTERDLKNFDDYRTPTYIDGRPRFGKGENK